MVAPRRRATTVAEERVDPQSAGDRPAGRRLTPATHHLTPTADGSPASARQPELAEAEGGSEPGAGFRHVTGWGQAGFRHVTRWTAAPSRPPRRRRPPPADASPRTPAGGRTGGSTSGGGRSRAARSGARTSRRGGHPGAGWGSPQRHVLSARHRPGRARHFRRRSFTRPPGFRTCRTLRLAEDRPLRRQDRGQRPRLLPPMLRRPRPAAPGPAVEPGAARRRVRPRDRTAAPPAPPRLRRLACFVFLHVQNPTARRRSDQTTRAPLALSTPVPQHGLERNPHT